MDAWSDIRIVARRCRVAAVAAAAGAHDAKSVIDGMIHVHDLELDEYVPGTSVAANVLGWFERGPKIVHVAKGQPDDERVVVVAHELGHFMLHSDPATDVTDVSMLLSANPWNPVPRAWTGIPRGSERRSRQTSSPVSSYAPRTG